MEKQDTGGRGLERGHGQEMIVMGVRIKAMSVIIEASVNGTNTCSNSGYKLATVTDVV